MITAIPFIGKLNIFFTSPPKIEYTSDPFLQAKSTPLFLILTPFNTGWFVSPNSDRTKASLTGCGNFPKLFTKSLLNLI
jgi:hypothetical protein